MGTRPAPALPHVPARPASRFRVDLRRVGGLWRLEVAGFDELLHPLAPQHLAFAFLLKSSAIAIST